MGHVRREYLAERNGTSKIYVKQRGKRKIRVSPLRFLTRFWTNITSHPIAWGARWWSAIVNCQRHARRCYTFAARPIRSYFVSIIFVVPCRARPVAKCGSIARRHFQNTISRFSPLFKKGGGPLPLLWALLCEGGSGCTQVAWRRWQKTTSGPCVQLNHYAMYWSWRGPTIQQLIRINFDWYRWPCASLF